jgi:catechol 2,3-dioxygenase-like lactoylglutathione lyase family enzyme
MLDVRLEGLTLRVEDVRRSIEFYGDRLGFSVEIDKAPHFAMIRVA